VLGFIHSNLVPDQAAASVLRATKSDDGSIVLGKAQCAESVTYESPSWAVLK
jgi:hypothetical protein